MVKRTPEGFEISPGVVIKTPVTVDWIHEGAESGDDRPVITGGKRLTDEARDELDRRMDGLRKRAREAAEEHAEGFSYIDTPHVHRAVDAMIARPAKTNVPLEAAKLTATLLLGALIPFAKDALGSSASASDVQWFVGVTLLCVAAGAAYLVILTRSSR